jgi:hypothetical protein
MPTDQLRSLMKEAVEVPWRESDEESTINQFCKHFPKPNSTSSKLYISMASGDILLIIKKSQASETGGKHSQ